MLVGHGSKTRGFDKAMRKVARQLRRDRLYSEVCCAFLEVSLPSIPEAISNCVEKGAAEVRVLPYFVLTGKHVTGDIPRIVAAEAKKHRPQARILLCPYLGYHPGIVSVVKERVGERVGVSPRVIPCGVALIRRGREFLISQRKKDDTFGSFWEFPGGKKNEGETFEQCTAREVKEEMGIDIEVHEKFTELRRKYHDRVIWLNFFLCTHVAGEPSAVDCAKVAWVDVQDLKKYEFPPANEAVIKKLIELVR